MDRYSEVTNKNQREIVLLKAFPCKWGKCSFCDYILDNSKEEEEINKQRVFDFINKNIVVKVIDNNLYVYYDHKLITLHTVSNKKINYHENHHLAMMSLTFRNSDKEDVKNYAAKHLEEMKKFNEQLSTVTEELT